MNKWITYSFTAVYIILIVGIIEFYYDDNHTNDHLGSILFLVLMMIQSIHQTIRNRSEGKKQSFIRQNGLTFVLVGVLIWFVLKTVN